MLRIATEEEIKNFDDMLEDFTLESQSSSQACKYF